MSGYAIRLLADGDGDALAELHRRAILATPDEFYTLAQKESWAFGIAPEAYPAGDGVFEVAVGPDGVPIALCHAIDAEILGLYIDPEHQRRGIGSALLARGEAWIAARGNDTASVKATLSARAFYERHGYALVTMSEHKTRGGLMLPSVILRKTLGR